MRGRRFSCVSPSVGLTGSLQLQLRGDLSRWQTGQRTSWGGCQDGTASGCWRCEEGDSAAGPRLLLSFWVPPFSLLGSGTQVQANQTQDPEGKRNLWGGGVPNCYFANCFYANLLLVFTQPIDFFFNLRKKLISFSGCFLRSQSVLRGLLRGCE